MKALWSFLMSLGLVLGCVGADTARVPALVPVFQDDTHQFTGVTLSHGGRMFVNYPRWQSPHEYDVVELMSNGAVGPFPNADWNNWQPGTAASNHWVCVQAVWVDDQDRLWVVDPASPEMKGVQGHGAKLVSIDLQTDTVLRIYNLTAIAGEKSYLNDVRVDTQAHRAYLTESALGGLIVLDTDSGAARLVLRDHYSVKADPCQYLVVNGQKVMRNGKPFRGNSDGIALSPDRQWLYYKALSDTKLYRVRTSDLCNTNLSERRLEKRVEDLGGNFTTSDGMIFDPKGRLYLSDAEHDAIVRFNPATGAPYKLETVAHDVHLLWPDTFSWGADGQLYVTCSQIQNMPWCHNGTSTRTTPYTLYKLKPQP